MDNKSFISSIFDFSFRSFVTPKFIKFLFVLGIIIAAICTIIMLVSCFIGSVVIGVVALIFSPIIFLLYVLAMRIYLELMIVIFRLQEDVAKLVEKNQG